MSIDTREELIDALVEASEVEHGVLLQYLFAAYSLKKRADEGLGPVQQEKVRRWAGALLSVARQEMAHLGCVCNLMSAIGGAPRLGRPNFPQPADRYYPFDFRLRPYGDEALYQFILFELPEGEPPPEPPGARVGRAGDVVPDPLAYEFLGELYGKIRHGFEVIAERELFIGPRFAQDTDDWSNRFSLRLVTDRRTALAAIDAIVLEGEGAPESRTPSHYATFLALRKALAAEPFEPARPVAWDPRTRSHPDAPDAGTLITEPRTVRVAELANSVYRSMLMMLLQYYSFGGESPAQRDALRMGLRNLMSGVFRPLAEVLTELPVAPDATGGTAGAPFEIYAEVQIATQPANRWPILLERLDSAADAASKLGTELPRLAFLGESLRWLGHNLRGVA
ncbi:ferritin-like domain-containing protein [Paractinoplanes deccanensis]|nr:ferritin-like domain-containing protein [Actinoplanes deccanensis]